jgi:hypothetical protein
MRVAAMRAKRPPASPQQLAEDTMGRSAAARQTAADPFMEAPMLKTNDLSRSVIPFKQGNTLIAVIEMSLPSWLVAGIVPGMERHPLKKLDVDPDALLRLLHRWREEAIKAGCAIERIVIAYEASRQGSDQGL